MTIGSTKQPGRSSPKPPVTTAAPAATEPAGPPARARRDRALDLVAQVVDQIRPRQRTDVGGRIERIADLQRRDGAGQLLLELVRDRVDDDEPLRGDARLARVDVAPPA